LFGTYDGFYTESFALSEGEAKMIDKVREETRRLGLIATDMETATLMIAGRTLGAKVASLCLGTVDGMTQAKLDPDQLAARERDMFETALDALVAVRAP
jgi:uridine phosphorylase